MAIDLSEMGSITRSLGNVISHINGKLAAAGASSRLEAVDQTPKTNKIVIGGRTIETRYTGPKTYALKVDVRASERVAFEPVAAEPSFYVLGDVSNGARLIKLSDVDGATAQPSWLPRPAATVDAAGDYVAGGWYGAGAPYSSAPAGTYENRSVALTSDAENTLEDALRTAGEVVLKLQFADGRTLQVSTAWRTGDQEAWRTRDGESEDQALLDDLAERLTQLLHEQGVAAGVDIWQDGSEGGLSVFTADQIAVSSFSIGGKSITLDRIAPSGMDAGLRDGVFARRFEAVAVAAASDLFVGDQSFTFTTATGVQNVKIVGGDDGITAASLVSQLNTQLAAKGVAARAALVDVGGALTLQIDSLHDLIDVSATLNEVDYNPDLVAPGAWASGGLPAAASSQPFGDAIRQYAVSGGSPLLTYAGALDIEIVVATATGDKTIGVSVSALERWRSSRWRADGTLRSSAARSGAQRPATNMSALTAAILRNGRWPGAGQRIASISINGDALDLQAEATGNPLGGGAFGAERSFTSAEAATGVSDVAALLADRDVSIGSSLAWGAQTISTALQPGDPRTLESAALPRQRSAGGGEVTILSVAAGRARRWRRWHSASSRSASTRSATSPRFLWAASRMMFRSIDRRRCCCGRSGGRTAMAEHRARRRRDRDRAGHFPVHSVSRQLVRLVCGPCV
ncbi:MAG: hypothetical protein R3C16_01495 [Hyphomonadaceae bacterium]